MVEKIIKHFDLLRWRLIAFSLLVAIMATLFTLLMLGYLCPIEPLANFLAQEGRMVYPYGWFHCISLACMIVIVFLLIKFCGHVNDRKYRLILFVSWFILAVFELFKQFAFYYYYHNLVLTVGYLWNAFPFQFCALVHYVLPFVFLLNDGKVRDASEMFLIVYVVFGGLVNMLYPTTVLCHQHFLNVQTMVHHGSLIALSIYMAYYRRDKLNIRHFLSATIVLFIAIAIAVILNETIYHVVPEVHAKLPEQTFNMFYISPYFPTVIPVFKLFQPFIPSALFIILYAIGFMIVAYVILILYSLIMNHQVKPCWSFTLPQL